MKVLNYTTSYFAALLLLIIPIWAGVFYYAMLNEIYDSIDDGLDNQKLLIIAKSKTDSTIFSQQQFDEANFRIKEIKGEQAVAHVDIYDDTMMFMQNENDFEPVRMLRTFFQHQNKYYEMEVVTSMVEEDDLIRQLLSYLVWLYVGLLLTILVLNSFLLKRIWRPFYNMMGQLKSFTLEKPEFKPIKKTRITEFDELNKTVSQLLKSNISSYESQKHLVENASHELQTPLAIAINKLEAIAENGRLNDEEMKLLSGALDQLDRLTRLNRSLLLLSKIENRQFINETEVSLNEVVNQAVSDFSDQLQFSQISVSNLENATLKVSMNRDLARILVNNLIKNAIVHNHPKGSVEILIEKSSLTIANTGRETPLDGDKLFSRFSKQQHSTSSTGLGLAIAKAITDLYGHKIEYSFHGKHRIKVTFF